MSTEFSFLGEIYLYVYSVTYYTTNFDGLYITYFSLNTFHKHILHLISQYKLNCVCLHLFYFGYSYDVISTCCVSRFVAHETTAFFYNYN